jgi:hypothetical protein
MRIRDITMDGFTVKIAPFSFDAAEEYLKTNRELKAKNPPPTEADWTERVLQTVCASLNKAAGNTNGNAPWDVKRVRAELDMVFVFYLHDEILRMSGIKLAQPGEALATST